MTGEVIDLDDAEMPVKRRKSKPWSERPKAKYTALCGECGHVQKVTNTEARILYTPRHWQNPSTQPAWPCQVHRKCQAHGGSAVFVFNDRQTQVDRAHDYAIADEVWRQRLLAEKAEKNAAERVAALDVAARLAECGFRVFWPKKHLDNADPRLHVRWWLSTNTIQLTFYGRIPWAERRQMLEKARRYLVDDKPENHSWWPCWPIDMDPAKADLHFVLPARRQS